MPKFKNVGQRIVHILGESGLYEHKIHLDEVLSICTEQLNTSISHVRSVLSKNKQYFEKDDTGMYSFSLTGASIYSKIKEERKDISEADLETFFERCCLQHRDDVWQHDLPRIDIRFIDLFTWADPDFAYDMLCDRTKYTMLKDAFDDFVDFGSQRKKPVEINIVDLPEVLSVGEVQTAQVGKLISVRGRVLMQSPIHTRARIAAFACQRCGQVSQVEQPMMSSKEIQYCSNEMCNKKGPFIYSETESDLIDQQVIMLEPPEGQITVTVVLQSDLCEIPNIRDCKDVIVTGYLCIEPDFSKNGTWFHTRYIDAIGIKFAEADIDLTDTDREIFKTWANDPADLRRRIIGTLAPDVVGREDEKDALSLIFFSDTKWNEPLHSEAGRSSIHFLLIGDPGVSKSVLAKDVARLAIKSSFADAVNSTAAGLGNAYIQVDGKPMLRGGVLAKGDQGITVIDEIDKLGNKDDIKKLGSVLEEQMQIVDKGGLSMTFPGRTSVICTANPKFNRIDPYEAIYPQIDIDDHILTRFDFIIVMRDIPDPTMDRQIVNSIFKRVRQRGNDTRREIDIKTFKKFLKYMREVPEPTISDEMETIITEYFLNIRKRYDQDKEAPITSRSVTDLIRIAICVARREMADAVNITHARYAVDLYERCLATQNPDGELDFMGPTLAMGKKTRAGRDMIHNVTKLIQNYKNGLGKWPTFEELWNEAKIRDMSLGDLEESLREISKNGDLRQNQGMLILI